MDAVVYNAVMSNKPIIAEVSNYIDVGKLVGLSGGKYIEQTYVDKYVNTAIARDTTYGEFDAIEIDANRILLGYQVGSGSSGGVVRVVTVNADDSFTYGTPFTIVASGTFRAVKFAIVSAGKFVLTYTNSTGVGFFAVIVNVASDGTITIGTPVNIKAVATVYTARDVAINPTGTQGLVIYNASSVTYIMPITISGNTITIGTEATVQSANTYSIGVVALGTAKYLILFDVAYLAQRDAAVVTVSAGVATVSGAHATIEGGGQRCKIVRYKDDLAVAVFVASSVTKVQMVLVNGTTATLGTALVTSISQTNCNYIADIVHLGGGIILVASKSNPLIYSLFKINADNTITEKVTLQAPLLTGTDANSSNVAGACVLSPTKVVLGLVDDNVSIKLEPVYCDGLLTLSFTPQLQMTGYTISKTIIDSDQKLKNAIVKF